MKRTLLAFFSLVALLSILTVSPSLVLAEEVGVEPIIETTSTVEITPPVEESTETESEEIVEETDVETVEETNEEAASTEEVVIEEEEMSLRVSLEALTPVIDAPVCEINGLYGKYYNLPSDHPDVEGSITGLTSGETPFMRDWYDDQYLSFTRTDAIGFLNQPADFFPVDDGLPGDPFYTAIHWTGYVYLPEAGDYEVAFGADDDAWFYLNGEEKINLGGIHAFGGVNELITFPAGTSSIDIYFAERHTVQSGIVFEILHDEVSYSPCNPEANEPPVWTGPTSATTTVSTTLNLTITPSDPDSDPLTITTTLPTGATYNTSTNAFSFTPNATGTFTATFVANDGLASSTHVLTIEVG
ncbi:MAG: hypothetical protein KGZ30_02010, partial [Anaplasmataceae bacterium]|nr:hypothetical protein [Anaplasmataceae bacterium]